MNRVKTITLGTLSGMLSSLVIVMMAGSLWGLLAEQPSMITTIVAFGLLNGAVIGGTSCLLAQVTDGIEHRLLVVLISVAMAAISVLFGTYDRQSLEPLALYAVAFVNGLLVGQVTAVLVQMRST